MPKVKKTTSVKKKSSSATSDHETRTHRLHMLLSDAELEMLTRVAKKMALTRSDAVRQMIRKNAA